MSSTKLYSKKMLNVFRIIAFVCFLVLLVAQIIHFIEKEPYTLNIIIINFLNLLLFLLMVIMPQRFGLMAISSFSYAVFILTTEHLGNNPMGFFMYILTFVFLLARGFFRKRKFLKISAAIVVFFILFSTEYFLDSKFFLSRDLIESIAYGLVLFLIIFFTVQYVLQTGNSSEKTLDLSKFPELTARDKEWLRLVQQETKYDVIAKQYNMSFGAVRNRFHQIYKIIDVSDRIGFMAAYGGYTLKD